MKSQPRATLGSGHPTSFSGTGQNFKTIQEIFNFQFPIFNQYQIFNIKYQIEN